jgi:N-acetylglucosamine kinase-like BadF-type ATPase
MSLYLAIDGGNSKTDVVVGTADGEIRAYVRGPGTCHQNIGLPETVVRLRSLVAKARAAAGLDDTEVFDRADIFLAGADLPAEVDALTTAITAQGWAPTLRVDNDTLALLRTGTDSPDAVAVVCGAGINCVGRTADGRMARFPSLGDISGDWGGGGHLASLTLWHAIRGEDGRGPATALAPAVAGHFGMSTVDDVATAVQLGHLERARIAELTPVLFDVADAGDPVARDVVARQADEVVSLAVVAASRLDLLDSPFIVVLGGGVLRARRPLLQDRVVEGIHVAAPKATITVVDAPPVLGAALYALDALGASAAAHDAVRAAVTQPPE